MMLIEACVRTELVDTVIRALRKIKVPCLSVIDVKAIGEDIGNNKRYSVEYGEPYAVRSKIKVFCDDKKAQRIFDTIKKEAYTGHKGDGFISRIRLEEFEKI